jgi:hypothetical protein
MLLETFRSVGRKIEKFRRVAYSKKHLRMLLFHPSSVKAAISALDDPRLMDSKTNMFFWLDFHKF